MLLALLELLELLELLIELRTEFRLLELSGENGMVLFRSDGNSYSVGLSAIFEYLECGRSGSGNSSMDGLKYSAVEYRVENRVARGEALTGKGLRRTELTEEVEAVEYARDRAVADCVCECWEYVGFFGREFGRCWFSCGCERLTGVFESVRSDGVE